MIIIQQIMPSCYRYSSGHCIAHVVRPAIVLHMLFVRPLYCTCHATSSLAVFQNYCFCEGEENQNTNKWCSHYVVLHDTPPKRHSLCPPFQHGCLIVKWYIHVSPSSILLYVQHDLPFSWLQSKHMPIVSPIAILLPWLIALFHVGKSSLRVMVTELDMIKVFKSYRK